MAESSFQPQTSFIPKKPLVSKKDTRKKSSGGSFLFVAGVIIFLVVLFAAGGVFLLKQYLVRDIEQKGESLQRAEEAFDTETIQNLARLDQRISAVQELLSNHTAVTPLFSLLEEKTLKAVRFDSFDLSLTDQNEVLLSMKGEADSFAAVVLQSDAFSETRYIRSPVFSDLNPEADRGVTFTFSALIDPALLSFGIQLTQ